MRITNWEINEFEDTREIAAEIDGFRLWFRLPKSYSVSRAGDPFLAAALLPAMLRGEKLVVDPRLSVSPKLLKNLSVLQEIHHTWNPVFKIIPIDATTRPSDPVNSGAMSFFSGGVDSTYTFLKRMDDISHLVFIQGIDFYASNEVASTFSTADFGDLSQFAYKLRHPADAVSAFLSSMLSETTSRALQDYEGPGSGVGTLEASLAEDLKRVIDGEPIYDSSRFAGVKLRSETKQLLGQPSTRGSQSSLNRFLLEDAYPIEIARRNSAIYQTAIERNTLFAQGFKKTLIPLGTNHYPFGYRYNLSRNLTQGSVLASVALLLGFPRAFVPGAYSYSQLIPLGSHPLTDPLYSTEGVEIIHDGAEARRVDKVVKIAESPLALSNLRVCFEDMNINCGECAKCLRTTIPLQLLSVPSPPFPSFPSLAAIKSMRIANDIEMIFFQENYEFAERTGNNALRDTLHACLRRYERVQLLKKIDEVLLGGLIKRRYQRGREMHSGLYRINTIPPKN